MLTLDVAFARGNFRLLARAQLASPVTGIFGPSGAGKSTLLALVAGLLAPQRGRIELDGRVLVDTAQGIFVPPHQRHVGIVFQDARLFPHLDVRGNLLYGFRRRAPEARHFALDEVAALLEIDRLLARAPHELSGGERQRVALGRAVLCSPRLLLLDEPLASLDGRLKEQILPFLRRVHEQTRIPACYVSHDLGEIRYLTDDVLVLRDGQLAPDAPALSSAS